MSSYIDQFIYDPNRDTQKTFEEVQAELKSNKAYSSEEEKLDVDLDNKDTEKNDEKANLLHKAFDYIQLAGASLVIVIILIILGKFLG